MLMGHDARLLASADGALTSSQHRQRCPDQWHAIIDYVGSNKPKLPWLIASRKLDHLFGRRRSFRMCRTLDRVHETASVPRKLGRTSKRRAPVIASPKLQGSASPLRMYRASSSCYRRPSGDYAEFHSRHTNPALARGIYGYLAACRYASTWSNRSAAVPYDPKGRPEWRMAFLK